jgi:hypothetical protein
MSDAKPNPNHEELKDWCGYSKSIENPSTFIPKRGAVLIISYIYILTMYKQFRTYTTLIKTCFTHLSFSITATLRKIMLVHCICHMQAGITSNTIRSNVVVLDTEVNGYIL